MKSSIYDLNRNFWDFAFNNPDKIKPIHSAIYYFALEHNNRLGWKDKFGLPTSMVMEAVGIKSYSVYKKAFDDLVSFDLFDIKQYSKNQFSSNIIALKENYKANYKALDKALSKHNTKQCSSTLQSTDQSTVSIIIHNTIYNYTNIQYTIIEDVFKNIDLLVENKNELKKFISNLSKNKTNPTLKEVIEYFIEKGFREDVAKKAFEYYDVAGWKDSNGKSVLNWKQKMQSVWFKDENKNKQFGSTNGTGLIF